jgi:nucleotide-binding universal stress UspA family protein
MTNGSEQMRILLAIDGSECSMAAVEEVGSRLWPEGTQVRILAVNAPAYPYPIPDPFLVLEGARIVWAKEERKRLETLVKEVAMGFANTPSGSRLEITTDVIDGTPKVIILGEADQWDADLIIVGSHGFGDVKRFVLGSVSQAVASHAHCSVEIVRPKRKKPEKAH